MLREIDGTVGYTEGELIPPSWEQVIEHFEDRLKAEAEENAREQTLSDGNNSAILAGNMSLGVVDGIDGAVEAREAAASAQNGGDVPAGNSAEVQALEALLRVKQTETSLDEVRILRVRYV